VLRFIV
jgi:hypothetical protein